MSGVDNPLAFPSVETHPSFDIPMHHFGMTLRDWFAGQALAGLVATEGDGAAKYAYFMADAMLAERSKAIAVPVDHSADLLAALQKARGFVLASDHVSSARVLEQVEAAIAAATGEGL